MSKSHEPFITATGMVVDPQRIDTMDMQLFKPFVVHKTKNLARALALGRIDADSEVLVAEVGNGVMILDKAQMSYHHTAQGEHRGQPWMVCF